MGSNPTLECQNKEQCRRALTLQVRTQPSTFKAAQARHTNVTKIPRFLENKPPTGVMGGFHGYHPLWWYLMYNWFKLLMILCKKYEFDVRVQLQEFLFEDKPRIDVLGVPLFWQWSESLLFEVFLFCRSFEKICPGSSLMPRRSSGAALSLSSNSSLSSTWGPPCTS